MNRWRSSDSQHMTVTLSRSPYTAVKDVGGLERQVPGWVVLLTPPLKLYSAAFGHQNRYFEFKCLGGLRDNYKYQRWFSLRAKDYHLIGIW